MKESYVEGLATRGGPESCAAVREGDGEALTGVRAGRVSSREKGIPGSRPIRIKLRESVEQLLVIWVFSACLHLRSYADGVA